MSKKNLLVINVVGMRSRAWTGAFLGESLVLLVSVKYVLVNLVSVKFSKFLSISVKNWVK